MNIDIDTCSTCGEDVSKYPKPNCPACGHYIGPPNVREVSRDEEKEALEERYEVVFEMSQEDGSYSNLMALDGALHKTCAVVNVDLDFLYAFLTNDKAL